MIHKAISEGLRTISFVTTVNPYKLAPFLFNVFHMTVKLTSINFNVFVMHYFFLQGTTFKGLSGTVGSSAIHVATLLSVRYVQYLLYQL